MHCSTAFLEWPRCPCWVEGDVVPVNNETTTPAGTRSRFALSEADRDSTPALTRTHLVSAHLSPTESSGEDESRMNKDKHDFFKRFPAPLSRRPRLVSTLGRAMPCCVDRGRSRRSDLLLEPTRHRTVWLTTTRAQTKAGEKTYVDVSFSLLTHADGCVAGALAVAFPSSKTVK